MSMLIIRHKVRRLRQVASRIRFALRNAEGGWFEQSTVLRSPMTKTKSVIIFDTTDTKKAKEFATSSDLTDVMTKAGVIDVPTMYFLESI